MRFTTRLHVCRRPVCALLAPVLAMQLGAQQTPPTPAASTPPGVVRFQANTQLVIETVTVKDKNGKPVEGLTAKDFTITEDGVVQTISFCEYQKLEDAAAIAPQTAPVATPAAPPTAVAAVTNHQITPER